MSVAAVSGPALSRRHGTGIQTIRILAAPTVRHWHLYWSPRPGLPSDCCHSACLSTMPWLRRVRGERVVRGLENLLGLGWWKGADVNRRKLSSLLSRRGWRADVAYVCVSSEREAARARSLLAVLDCPYVVHLWDLCHESGLDPGTMPGYAGLLGSAAAVLVLTPAMAEELRGFAGPEPRVVGFGQEVRGGRAEAPQPDAPLRIVLVGSLGEPDNPFPAALGEAWDLLRSGGVRPEMVYVGRHLQRLPAQVRADARSAGLLSDDEYHSLLCSCHIALLPSPSRLDAYGRYSLPSRVGDYLMAGLPVVASVGKGSATEAYLRRLTPEAVRFARGSRELAESITALCERGAWPAASRRARSFAEEHFDIRSVRDQVLGALREACGRSD